MWFIGKLSRNKQGVGPIIGGVFILLILLTGYTFYFLNVNVTEDYNKTLEDMEKLDLKRNKENIEFISVSFNEDNKLNITVKNTGSYDAHLIWLGIFYETANTQQYYEINYYVNPAETVRDIRNETVTTFEGQERVIQLVTELGNTFSCSYPRSEEEEGAQASVTITGENCTAAYTPSQWNLLGSTENVSGSVSDLASNDTDYVVFRSYYSAHPLSGWDKRVKITIDNNDVDSALSNFPVLLCLSNSSGRHNDDVTFVFDEVGSNSKKIAVTTNDGTTECYVEIEKWDAASGQAWLWVKVPSISNTTETDLYLYYDADHADNTDYVGEPDSIPAETVWDSYFKTVLHLHETSGIHYDSTSNNNNGTPQGGVTQDYATGEIDGADDFNGADGYIDFSTSFTAGQSEVTLELWVYLDEWVAGNTIYDAYYSGYHWQFSLLEGTWYTRDASTGSSGSRNNDLTWSNPGTAAWHHLALRYSVSDGVKAIYVDGSLEASTSTSIDTLTTDRDDERLGYPCDGTYFDGKIDELRISTGIARSVAWIKASYESERDDLLNFGPEDYVDETCDLHAPSAKGTHSNFAAQQAGPDSIYDTLTEESIGGAGAWLSGWSYRKNHTINSAAGAGANYQVKVVVHYGSGSDFGQNVYCGNNCTTDFGDIRFTDDDGVTELDYWMEEKHNSDNATFWVEVADDLSSNDVPIYVYYGKSDATTTSNGTNTFKLFDDFEGGTIIFQDDFEDGNLDGWTTGGDANFFASTNRAYGGVYSAEGGDIGHNQQTWIQKSVTLSQAGSVSFQWKISSESGYDEMKFEIDTVVQKQDVSSSETETPWLAETFSLSSGTHTLRWTYYKDGSVTMGDDTMWLDNVVVVEGENARTAWTKTGNAYWLAGVAYNSAGDGNLGYASGDVGNSQESSIEKAVDAPFEVSFYWWVSSETNYDYLHFYIDITEKAVISGNQGYTYNDDAGPAIWEYKSFTETGSGSKTLKWTYDKDGGASEGADRGGLDLVIVRKYVSPEPSHGSWGNEETGNYELDLEVQWTTADYDEMNEELCIKTGTFSGSEDLQVKVRSGGSWVWVMNLTASQWNNVSVTSYLTGSTFTIQFLGGTETSDSTQDNWDIDVTLLHVWSDEYTMEVEFTGSSNTEDWTRLVWQIDSCWDIGEVTVTIQFYNYTLGDYAPTGNGTINYVSDTTPNTDELKSKTITSDPGNFKNSTGHWKVKIKGVKSTDTQFQMKIDWIEIQTTYSSSGTTIPYDAWQWYIIEAATANGDPIPYTYISIYANGTDLAFRNATDEETVSNPGWVRLNADGEYQLEIKSTHTSAETFVLYAVAGSVVGQKTITQEAP